MKTNTPPIPSHVPQVKTVQTHIDRLLAQQKQVVVAIDGDCAAGKTTLSELLKEAYTCPVIHMDHFFLQPQQRTVQRLSTPGGNLDRERFILEVIQPIQNKEAFSYRPFCCQTERFKPAIPIEEKAGLILIEGSYSHHPEWQESIDLKIFLAAPKDVQHARILKRNGAAMLERFKHEWIPLEKKYSAAFRIQENSDLQLDYLNLTPDDTP